MPPGGQFSAAVDTAPRQRLDELGCHENRIYLDYGLTGTNRKRPGLDQALAAVRPTTRSWCRSSIGSPAGVLPG